MNQTEAMHKAKAVLGQKSLAEMTKEESWIVLDQDWEINIWQDEDTGAYKSAIFPVNSEGDISGEGIVIFSLKMYL